MRTNLIGLKKHSPRGNWAGFWTLDGHEFTSKEAHKFVDMAIDAGYTFDEDVPEDMIRKWFGWDNAAEPSQGVFIGDCGPCVTQGSSATSAVIHAWENQR